MDFTNFALFFAASWILIITPGPDMIYVITRGVAQGRMAGFLSAVGVTIGILVHTVFAACGLAVILRTSALAFTVVKFIGAAYLIYLGIQSFRNQVLIEANKTLEKCEYRKIFFQGVLSNVFNPKIAIFFLAFLPQFVNPSGANVGLQMIWLGLIFALWGFMFLSLVGYFSGKIGRWIIQRPRVTGILRWLTGSILVGLGLRLAVLERR